MIRKSKLAAHRRLPETAEAINNAVRLAAGSGSVVESCRECGKIFDPLPDNVPQIIRDAWNKIDICAECCGEQLTSILRQNS